jgi:hypothetical protein
LLLKGGDYTKMNKAGCTPAALGQESKDLAPLLISIMAGEEVSGKTRALHVCLFVLFVVF